MWPEVTDSEKFVYEDVAIAAYLLVRVCATVASLERVEVATGRCSQ